MNFHDFVSFKYILYNYQQFDKSNAFDNMNDNSVGEKSRKGVVLADKNRTRIRL